MTMVQTLKGWFYVAVTALLVYLLILRQLNRSHQQKQEMAEFKERRSAERLRADQEIQKTQNFFEVAVNNSPAGIILADAPDGRIRLLNNKIKEIRGETNFPLMGITFDQHPSHWQLFGLDGVMLQPEQTPLYRAIIEEQPVDKQELILRDDQGEAHWLQTIASPVKNAEGNVIAGMLIINEITKQKSIEQALIASEERFATAMRGSQDAIWDWDVEQERVYFSPAWKGMLGMEPASLSSGNR